MSESAQVTKVLVRKEETPEETKVQDVFEDYNNQPEPEEDAKSPVQEVIDPTPAPILYDADAEQSFTFEIEDDDARYEITQVFGALEDKVIAEYDRFREVAVEQDGKDTEIKTNSVIADEYLFEKLCLNILGFEGDKPENWKDLIAYDEKKIGIQKLLGHKIVTDKSQKVVKPRSWGEKVSTTNTLVLKAYFDGGIVETKAHFEDKKPGDIALYESLKSRVRLSDKGVDESEIKIPASMKKKATLFDRLDPRVEGYAGRVPMHHKAAFITARYESTLSMIEKK